jgi:probable phosphoglycerate mutase
MARQTKNSPTLILMVRHGRTPTTGKVLPGRAAGLHLADSGKAEAEAVAKRIAEIKGVSAVYASPLERARETAAPIGKILGQKVNIHKGLLECDFGDWTGAQLTALMKKPMQQRMVSALDDIRAKHPGGIVVCVSHADPIKAAVAHAMGTHIDLFQRIVISTCSVSAVAYSPSGPVVLTVNSTGGSLADLRPS